MANRNKKFTHKQKRERGIEKPKGKSKYALKKARQARGIYNDTSPFKIVQ